MPLLPNLTLRLTHTGLFGDGRTNTQGILLDDLNQGETQQHRKHTVYIPANGSIDVPLTDRVLFSYTQGSIHGYIQTGQLTAIVPINSATESTASWTFETSTLVDYVGGFYDFAGTDNDFSPSTTFGVVNATVAAHFLVVTGAVTTDEVTLTVTGTSITDNGVNTTSDTQDIVIPAGTPPNSYFETPKKWNGQVTVETTGGTAITCNYGWCKYWDHNNRDFDIIGFETIWTSQNTDSTSDIELIHHKSAGWTFNSGSEPDPPTPLAARSTDHGADLGHVDGTQGAWKRDNLAQHILGGDSEGLLWRMTSASAGLGSQSFRHCDILIIVQECPLGEGFCSP